MHGTRERKKTQKRKKKKAGGRAEKMRQRAAGSGRKFNRLPTGYPIPPAPKVIKRYRHTCTCGRTFVADSQEAFCRYCRSNALIITDVLENS